MSLSGLFFWGFIATSVWADIHFNILAVSWLWSNFLSPIHPWNWLLVPLVLSLFVEDEHKLIWPFLAIYLCLAWHYNVLVLDNEFWASLSENWMIYVGYFLTYMFTGFAWSVLKLRMYAKDYIDKTNYPNYFSNMKTNQDKALYMLNMNKQRILGWILYWPLSLLHFVSYDMFVRIYNMLFNGLLKRVYMSVIVSVLQSVFPEANEEASNNGSESDEEEDSHGRNKDGRARSVSPGPSRRK